MAMKQRTGVTCLAIGDGNNDTPMIKIADIGVVRAFTDLHGFILTSRCRVFVVLKAHLQSQLLTMPSHRLISHLLVFLTIFHQFRFLERLLLVYGRLNNRRISTLINYIFYKTTIVSWAVLMFGL